MASNHGLEVSLRDSTVDADQLEAERLRARAIEEGTNLVKDHLREFLASNPGATYEQWIAALHPENVQLDHRLRLTGNPWLQAWDEAAGGPSDAKVTELRWVHGALALFSMIWAVLTASMLESGRRMTSTTTVTMGLATALSISLFLVQLVMFLSAFRHVKDESWPRHIYVTNVGQLVAQSVLTISSLTSFVFHEHGLSISDCLSDSRCVTAKQGKGYDQDVLVWKKVTGGRFYGGPFSSVNISVDLAKTDGQKLNRTTLSYGHGPCQGPGCQLWDGISIRAAVPLEASYTLVDKGIIYIILVFYALAMLTTLLYVCVYRMTGQSRARRIPAIFTLMRLEYTGCIVCGLLILTNLWSFLRHPHPYFVAPVFIGFATFIALVTQMRARAGKRQSCPGPFTEWQKRSVTNQAVWIAVALTYTAGLCDSFILCSTAGTWPSTLPRSVQNVFIVGCLISLILSAGYGFSLWLHLHMIRLRSACRAVVHSQVTRSPDEESPATASSVPAVGETIEAAIECIICMESARDTVLVPCGHYAYCNRCAMDIVRRTPARCALCRQTADDAVQVYSS
eukprot:TRINITY_DN539_c0_g2_i1.p1 TRINITY_DN539_c0_g2~~TRINITY_DN539_c0_g2_i1.p1  ORF type:complete len:567 (-),score=53.76 TRINITY_DN539_c0_g2_i1:156-1856(-)